MAESAPVKKMKSEDRARGGGQHARGLRERPRGAVRLWGPGGLCLFDNLNCATRRLVPRAAAERGVSLGKGRS